MRTCRSNVPVPQMVLTWWAAPGWKVMNSGLVKVVLGRPQFVWLKTFWASMRISGRKRPMGNERNNDMSTFHTDGVRNWLRRLVPKPSWPRPVGWEKSDLSYHGSVAEPGTPEGLGSPCTLMKIDPHPWQFSALLVPVMENGVPEYQAPTPLICQFLTIWASGFLESFANGS